MKKLKITKEILKAANNAMPSLKVESIRAILEAAFNLIELPSPKPIKKEAQKRTKAGRQLGQLKEFDLSTTSVLPRLRNGEVIIIPVGDNQKHWRFQANLKAIQCKPGNIGTFGKFNITTEQIGFFSLRDPEAGIFRGIKCVIEKPINK